MLRDHRRTARDAVLARELGAYPVAKQLF